MSDSSKSDAGFPPQQQDEQPGREHEMTPEPSFEKPEYKGSGKLKGQAALITGGDSGIGRAVAVLYAREGADVAIAYLEEDRDAETTKEAVEAEGVRCLLLKADVRQKSECRRIVQETVDAFGRLDVLVNNAAVQYPKDSILDISEDQLEDTFRTNIFAMFFTVQAALEHLEEGGAIINTSSVTAFRGSPGLLDYSATKGAITAFSRSLAQNKDILDKKIRVNSVAPGPIWTPLIPATFGKEKVSEFGKDTALERAGQPEEVAPAFVYLASKDSTYTIGQTIHVNGGEVVGG